MNETTTRSRTHVITGGRDEVRSALHRAHADGRLVAVTEARVLAGDRLRVVAQLRAPAGQRSRWERVRPWLAGAGKALAVIVALATAAAVVWGVVWLVMAVIALVAAAIAWFQAHLVGIGLTVAGVLVLLALLSAGSGGCGGMHCGGCRR